MTTRQQLLDSAPAFSLAETATILGETVTRGARASEPNPRAVKRLVRDGRLAVVDPTAPAYRWQVTRVSIIARLEGRSTFRVIDGAA